MSKYSDHFSTRRTSQSDQADPAQVKNNAGGYTFTVDEFQQLDRFLFLGCEGGTFYVKEAKLTKENGKVVQRCLDIDARRTIDRIVQVSTQGRAHKNDPALFALAIAAGHKDAWTRREALNALPLVARTGTHLFHFAEYVEAFRGWGRGLRGAVGHWYTTMSLDKLLLQAIKYKQRDGWSHRDLLRLSHPIPGSLERSAIFQFMAGKGVNDDWAPPRLRVADQLARNGKVNKKDAPRLIKEYRIPRESLDTCLLNDREVWAALFEQMPMTAMIRNLAKMTSVGLIKPLGTVEEEVCSRLEDQAYLKNARIHPISVLAAHNTYRSGAGVRGNLTWTPSQRIIQSLERAFYLTFDNVQPTNKRFLIGLDVSGSMDWGEVSGIPGLKPSVAAAAMSTILARTEPKVFGLAFTGTPKPLNFSLNSDLDTVLRETYRLPFGRTDCALPMIYALNKGLEVDVFTIYTDNETWCGNIHPHQALERYREKMGINAKLVVVAMTATQFSIANPNDPGMLDVVGFDTGTPTAISNFAQGY